MPTITKENFLYVAAPDLMSDTVMLGDGTMWSHAATLGTRIKGTAFTIDKATIENCIRVFRTGYPQKICVDYEHGTINGAADLGQPVPAAGQVKELKGVYAGADLTGELLATAKKLCEKVSRPLDDPRNFGLWMRWLPTARALQMVTQREYTELSIVLFHDMEHNVTGEGQGPAIFSIALTNTPFLDDMLPVAASRDNDRGTSTDLDESRNRPMPVPQVLQRAAALFGRAFTTEDEVMSATEDRITTLTRENETLKPFKAYHDAVIVEVAEPDPAKAATKIRELKATATAAQTAKEEQTKKTHEAERDKILLKHEKRLTPAQKDYFGPQLMVELTAGVKPGETKTEKVIESFPENKALGRKSAADGGQDAPTDRDARIALRANELLENDPALKRMAEKDDYGAFKKALARASSEIPRDEQDKK
jgi:phage I-like protein